MSNEVMSGEMLERYARGEASVPIPTFTRDVYRHLLARLDAAERDRDALREALDSIAVYGDDTLSGPVSEAAYRHWHRDGVRVMRDRARAALTANHSAPVVEE